LAVTLSISGGTSGGKLQNRLSVVAAHAIPRKLYAIEDTRHAHAAPRPNIRGSHRQNLKLQQEKKIHGLRSKYLQLFYFCITKFKFQFSNNRPYEPTRALGLIYIGDLKRKSHTDA
jgi:hypothetical protein